MAAQSSACTQCGTAFDPSIYLTCPDCASRIDPQDLSPSATAPVQPQAATTEHWAAGAEGSSVQAALRADRQQAAEPRAATGTAEWDDVALQPPKPGLPTAAKVFFVLMVICAGIFLLGDKGGNGSTSSSPRYSSRSAETSCPRKTECHWPSYSACLHACQQLVGTGDPCYQTCTSDCSVCNAWAQ